MQNCVSNWNYCFSSSEITTIGCVLRRRKKERFARMNSDFNHSSRDVWNSSHPWLSDDAKPLTNALRSKDSLGENEPFTNFNWTFWPLLIAIYCFHRVCIWRSFNGVLQRNSLNPFLFAMPIQWSSLCCLNACRAACTSKAKNCWNCIMNLNFVDSVKRINRTLNKIVSMNAFI